jgi:hypothetical protein
VLQLFKSISPLAASLFCYRCCCCYVWAINLEIVRSVPDLLFEFWLNNSSNSANGKRQTITYQQKKRENFFELLLIAMSLFYTFRLKTFFFLYIYFIFLVTVEYKCCVTAWLSCIYRRFVNKNNFVCVFLVDSSVFNFLISFDGSDAYSLSDGIGSIFKKNWLFKTFDINLFKLNYDHSKGFCCKQERRRCHDDVNRNDQDHFAIIESCLRRSSPAYNSCWFYYIDRPRYTVAP